MVPSRYAAFVSTAFAEDGSNARPLFELDFGPFMEAKGYNGQVRIDGDWLIIERKGLGRLGHSKGDKRIHQSEFDAIREQVENYVAERSAARVSAARPDPAEEIRKFAQLRDEGILSEDEFQAKKSEILGL